MEKNGETNHYSSKDHKRKREKVRLARSLFKPLLGKIEFQRRLKKFSSQQITWQKRGKINGSMYNKR